MHANNSCHSFIEGEITLTEHNVHLGPRYFVEFVEIDFGSLIFEAGYGGILSFEIVAGGMAAGSTIKALAARDIVASPSSQS